MSKPTWRIAAQFVSVVLPGIAFLASTPGGAAETIADLNPQLSIEQQEFDRDQAGRERQFPTAEIAEHQELQASLMSEGLIDWVTNRDIRDLLAFLDQRAAPTTPPEDASKFIGTWWLDMPDGYGAWLSVQEVNQQLQAQLLWRVGSARPVKDVSIQNGQLILSGRQKKKEIRYVATVNGDSIQMELIGTGQTGRGERCPPLPPRPDIDSILFGAPIELFNGRDLDGWQLQPPTAKNGWSVRDGELINETPKEDFSAYGSFGNLRTIREFGDCKLHVEFNIGTKRNSGIYVRGLYEIQVVDGDSPMQGINGPGAVFGRIAPIKNAGLPGGTWQTYDITLVDRHLTVELNGQRVIDNQPVEGSTGGAISGDVTSNGPLYLQGDHTSVRYRNLRLRPRIRLND